MPLMFDSMVHIIKKAAVLASPSASILIESAKFIISLSKDQANEYIEKVGRVTQVGIINSPSHAKKYICELYYLLFIINDLLCQDIIYVSSSANFSISLLAFFLFFFSLSLLLFVWLIGCFERLCFLF